MQLHTICLGVSKSSVKAPTFAGTCFVTVQTIHVILEWIVHSEVSLTIDNRPTEKGLETRNFLAISHSGARYDHVI